MSQRDVPGEELSNRLAARNGAGLHRKSMADGGEVYTGALATRALRTLGARAFTMDGTIFASQGFDPGANAEHAALYAHERFHVSHSGGDDGHGGERDQEEIEARAIEQMVFHRSEAGEELSTILSDVDNGGATIAQAAKESQKELVSKALIGGNKDRDPMDGYKAMKKEGKQHLQIITELKDFVVRSIAKKNEDEGFRSTRFDFFGG